MIPRNLPDDIGNRAPRETGRPAHLDDEAYESIGNRAVVVQEKRVADESVGNRDNLNYTNPFPSDSNLLGAAELYAVGGGRGRNGRRPNPRTLHARGQGNVGVWIGGTLEPGLVRPRGGKDSNGNVAPPEPVVSEETEVNGNRFGFIPGNGIGGGRKSGANGQGGRGKGARGQGKRGPGARGQGNRGQGKGAQPKGGQKNGQGARAQGGEGRQGSGGRGRGKGRGRQGGGNRPADAS